MTDSSATEFMDIGRTTSAMFEILNATRDDVVEVRMGTGTPAGSREFSDLLVEKTEPTSYPPLTLLPTPSV